MRYTFLKAINPGPTQIKEEGGMIGSLAHEWKGCSSIPTSQKMYSGAAGKRTGSFSSRVDRGCIGELKAWGEVWVLLLLLRPDLVVGVHRGVGGESQKVCGRKARPNKVPKDSKPFNQKLYL